MKQKNTKTELTKLGKEIDEAYRKIRECAAEASEIIYGDAEHISTLMDELAADEMTDTCRAGYTLQFRYKREKALKQIKAILEESEMDLEDVKLHIQKPE